MSQRTRKTSQADQIVVEPDRLESTIRKVNEELFEKINAKLNAVETKLNIMEDKFQNIKDNVKTHESQIKLLDKKIEIQQIMQKKYTLRIEGVAEEKNEDILNKIVRLFNEVLKVQCEERDVNDIYRIGKAQTDGKARTIIIKFVTYLKRKEIYKARKHLGKTGIYINEDLSPQQYKAFKEACQQYGKRNVWTINGKIMARAEDNVHEVKLN